MKKKLISAVLAVSMCMSVVSAEIFTDTESHWAKESINQISDLGIFKGTGDLFEPDSYMTRGMFVTVLGRFAEYQDMIVSDEYELSFSDVSQDIYYAKYVAWASEHGIVNGNGDGTFSPDGYVTREQMCAILDRFLDYAKFYNVEETEAISFADKSEILSYALSSVEKMQSLGIINGVLEDGVINFKPQKSATRAEVAKILVSLCEVFEEGIFGLTEDYGTIDYEQMTEYIEKIIAGYDELQSYVETKDEIVVECMDMLVFCMTDALGQDEELSKSFVESQYAEQISDIKQKYSEFTPLQEAQMNNIIVRLEEIDVIYQVMDFFGIS